MHFPYFFGKLNRISYLGSNFKLIVSVEKTNKQKQPHINTKELRCFYRVSTSK